ncbi:MAG: hypothetical protein GY697_23330 [Desulfobacterales bacterium]|nr:hypothetical protein [Desulfobacterales bacterium]
MRGAEQPGEQKYPLLDKSCKETANAGKKLGRVGGGSSGGPLRENADGKMGLGMKLRDISGREVSVECVTPKTTSSNRCIKFI